MKLVLKVELDFHEVPRLDLCDVIDDVLVVQQVAAPHLLNLRLSQRHFHVFAQHPARPVVRRSPAHPLRAVLAAGQLVGVVVRLQLLVHAAHGHLAQQQQAVGASLGRAAVVRRLGHHVREINPLSEHVPAHWRLRWRDPQPLAQNAAPVHQARPVPEEHLGAEALLVPGVVGHSVDVVHVHQVELVRGVGRRVGVAHELVHQLVIRRLAVQGPQLAVERLVVAVQRADFPSRVRLHYFHSGLNVVEGLEQLYFFFDLGVGSYYRRPLHAEVVRNSRVKLAAGSLEAGFVLRVDDRSHALQSLVTRLDLRLGQLSQGRLFNVEAQVRHGPLPFAHVEYHLHQLLQFQVQLWRRVVFLDVCHRFFFFLLLRVVDLDQVVLFVFLLELPAPLVACFRLKLFNKIFDRRLFTRIEPLQIVAHRATDPAPFVVDPVTVHVLFLDDLQHVELVVVVFDVGLVEHRVVNRSVFRVNCVLVTAPQPAFVVDGGQASLLAFGSGSGFCWLFGVGFFGGDFFACVGRWLALDGLFRHIFKLNYLISSSKNEY